MNSNKNFYRFLGSISIDRTRVFALTMEESTDLNTTFYKQVEACEKLKEIAEVKHDFVKLCDEEEKLLTIAERLELDILYFVNSVTGTKHIKGFYYEKEKHKLKSIELNLTNDATIKFDSVPGYLEFVDSEGEPQVKGYRIVSKQGNAKKPLIVEYEGPRSLFRLNNRLLRMLSIDFDQF